MPAHLQAGHGVLRPQPRAQTPVSRLRGDRKFCERDSQARQQPHLEICERVRGVSVRQQSKSNNNKKGTKPLIMEGTPPLRGVPYPTLDLQLWRAPVRFAACPTLPFNAVKMLKSKSTSAALFVGAATGRTLNYHTQKKFRRLAAAKFKSKAVKINGIVKVKSKVNVNYTSLAARRQGKAACGCLAATTCRFSPAHNEPKTCHS